MSRFIQVFIAFLLVAGSASAQLTATDPERFAMVFMANEAYAPDDINRLADIATATGARWMVLEVRWNWLEPNPPQATPSEGAIYGPRQGYHTYNFGPVDRQVFALTSRGVNVVIKFYHHPTWAGGQTCVGFDPPCGIVRTTHRQIFADGIYDLAYNMATRYPNVLHWAVWNEPDLAHFFSPQPPLNGGIIGEYIDRVAAPAAAGIRDANPAAQVVGPDIFTCESGLDDCELEDPNWGYSTRWKLWIDSIATYAPNLFDIFTWHTYGDDERAAIRASNIIGTSLAQRGLVKAMWLTEFNFRNGTCESSEDVIFGWTYALFRDMNWQRSFFNSLLDSNQTCGFGIVTNHSNPVGGLAPRNPLFPKFRAMVIGTHPEWSTLAEIENTTVTHYTDGLGGPPPLSPNGGLVLHGKPFGSVAKLEAQGLSTLLTPQSVSDTQLSLPVSALGGSRTVRVERRFPFPTGVEVRARSPWVTLNVSGDPPPPTCNGCQTLSGGICVNLPQGTAGNCGYCQFCDGSGACMYKDQIASNTAMFMHQYRDSCDGRFRFQLQGDHNLVLYGPRGAMWSRGYGSGANKASMQGDGNFVLYRPDETAVWASGTPGYNGSRLVVQNDGNVVIYTPGGAAPWSTGTVMSCGDGYCDWTVEDMSSCPWDCDPCAVNPCLCDPCCGAPCCGSNPCF